MKHSIFRSRRGFTLAELIAVIAIIAILVSLGATGYFALRKTMRIAEYDDIAREIYIAAQNRLTSLRVNGLSSEDSAALTSVSNMGNEPRDWDATDENGNTLEWNTVKGNYYYADNRQTNSADALELLLPLGSVDDAVRSNGYYVIEYNPVTGAVYGVFYSESTFVYAAVIGDESSDFRTDRAVRKAADPMVGYYGGSAVARDDLDSCDTPELTIENTDVLKLTVDNAVTHIDYTVVVSVSDGTNSVDIPVSTQSGAYNPTTGTLTLDELDGAHFYELFPTLTPGADITITVTFSKDGMLSSVASVTTNSLFASREDSDTGAAVEIAYARQLQNLEGSVSGLNESSALSARQTADIDLSQKVTWDSVSSAYVSSSRTNSTFTSVDNAGIADYDGQYYTISNLTGSNGLFASVAADTSLSSIRIVNPMISTTGTGNVGALVGTAGAHTIVSNCGVYCDASTTEDGTTTVSYSEYSSYGITAPSATVGGLIGSAESTTITRSFAALPSVSAASGGAFVGSAENCDITMSYAACDALDADIAYFLHGSGNTVAQCYAVGNLASDDNSEFVSGTVNAVKRSYYAVSHTDYSGSVAGEDLTSTEYAAYGSDGTRKDYTYEEFIADDGVASVVGMDNSGAYDQFTPVTAPLTHPYRAALSGRAYPYPGFYMLEHYGSWPTKDGTVKVTVLMRTTTGGSNYAYSAGHVQVWELETDENCEVITDEDGSEKKTLLFDNMKPDSTEAYAGKTYTGKYDGDYKKLTDDSDYIVLQVKPGTTIRVTMSETDAASYKVSGLTIRGATHSKENDSDTEISRVVPIDSGDTTVTATYRPGSYKLTLNNAQTPKSVPGHWEYGDISGMDEDEWYDVLTMNLGYTDSSGNEQTGAYVGYLTTDRETDEYGYQWINTIEAQRIGYAEYTWLTKGYYQYVEIPDTAIREDSEQTWNTVYDDFLNANPGGEDEIIGYYRVENTHAWYNSEKGEIESDTYYSYISGLSAFTEGQNDEGYYQKLARNSNGYGYYWVSGYDSISGTYYHAQWTQNGQSNIRYSYSASTVSSGTTVTVTVTNFPANISKENYTAVVQISYAENGKTITKTLDLKNDACTFEMPAADTTVNVLFVKNADMATVTVNYLVQGTDGEYAQKSAETKYYMKGTTVDTALAAELSAGSGRELTITDEIDGDVKVLDYSYFTLFNAEGELASSLSDAAASYTIVSGDELVLNVYIAREQYTLTLETGVNIASATADATEDTESATEYSHSYTLYYGQSVTATAVAEAGQNFTMWDTTETRFRKSSSPSYVFTMPHYDLTLTATAKKGYYLVELELTENGESWLASAESRKADPVSITLVNSVNGSEYLMTALTEKANSYIFQREVEAITDVGEGYYVRIEYESKKEFYYTTGNTTDGGYYGEDGVHDTDDDGTDDRLILTVRDKSVTQVLNFYTITYYPNTSSYSGTVPSGGTYPANSRIAVQGNPGLLVNNVKRGSKKQYLIGWRDGQATDTSQSDASLYTAGQYFLLTRKTYFYAEWASDVTVSYSVGEDKYGNEMTITGGTLPLAQTSKAYTIGSSYKVEAPSLEADGYKQVGWTCSYGDSCPYVKSGEKTCPGHKKDDTITLTTTGLVLTAQWELQHYTITYYDEDNTTVRDTVYNVTIYDSVTAASHSDSSSGLKFVGWSTEKGGSEVSYTAGTTITGVKENLNLYPVFAGDPVVITFHYIVDGEETTRAQTVGGGSTVVLNPNMDGEWTVTAWCEDSNHTGNFYLCAEDTAHTAGAVYVPPTESDGTQRTTWDLYAITEKVYNYNKQMWYDTLYDAVNGVDNNYKQAPGTGNTLIVYRDTTETKRVVFTEELGKIYVIASGDRTVKWTSGTYSQESTLESIGANEFCGCMFANNCAVTFGESDLKNLDVSGTLTFDANKCSRVMALKGSSCTFTMVDGVTLTNGYVYNSNGTSGDNARVEPKNRAYFGGGVYAADGAAFNMAGGTISYCTARAGGGVYIVGIWTNNKWQYTECKDTSYDYGASFSMGNMELATEYSASKIYYEKSYVNGGWDGTYASVSDGTVNTENYTDYYVTTGNPQIIFNTAKQKENNDGGGGIVLIEVDSTALNLFSGKISNNTATNTNGGGIILDACLDEQELRLYEIEISNNTAKNGGGIFVYQGIVWIYNADILQNKATQNGGGIYVTCASTYKNYAGAQYTDGNHETSRVRFYYGTIRENEAGATGLGGGIYLSSPDSTSTVSITVEDGQILTNSAYSGGGIYLANSSKNTATVNGGEIRNNTADRAGGGVYVSESSSFNLNGGYISGNTAKFRPDNTGDTVYKCDVWLSGTSNLSQKTKAVINTDTGSLAENLENDSEDPIYVMCYSSKRTPTNVIGRTIVKYSQAATFSEFDADCFAYTNGLTTYGTDAASVYVTPTVSGTETNYTYKAPLILSASTKSARTVYFSYTDSDGETASYAPEDTEIGDKILYSTVKENVTRKGYDLIGWSKVEDAELEDYVIYYQDDAIYMSYNATDKYWTYKYEDGVWYRWDNTAKDWAYKATYNGSWTWQALDTDGNWTDYADTDAVFTNEIDGLTSEGNPAYTVTSAYSQKLYAQWQAYSVTYELGSAPSAVTMLEGSKDVGPTVTLRGPDMNDYTDDNEIKYNFVGWSTEPDQTEVGTYTNRDTDTEYMLTLGTKVTLSESVTLYAVWQPEQVIITYDVNGGSNEGNVHTEKAAYGEAADVWDGNSYKPYDSRYILAGWATSEETADESIIEYTLEEDAIPAELTKSSLTLWAVWKPLVNVHYVTSGGAEPVTIQSFDGGTATLPAQDGVEEREGYTLAGWSTEQYSASADVLPGETVDVTEEVTYYGVWQIQVTFSTGNGTIDDTETQKYTKNNDGTYTLPVYENAEDKTITLPNTKWNDGTFTGWTIADTALTADENGSYTYTVNAPITFTAQWSCTVTLNANGGTFGALSAEWGENHSQTLSEGGSVTAPSEVTRTGYTLAGWATAADGKSEVKGGDSYTVNKNVTLYAVWTPNDNTVTLNLSGGTFNTNSMGGWAADSEGSCTQSAQTGDKINLPDANAVTREGYTLAGWAATADGEIAVAPGGEYTIPASESKQVTLYAVWTEESADSGDASDASLTDNGTEAAATEEP